MKTWWMIMGLVLTLIIIKPISDLFKRGYWSKAPIEGYTTYDGTIPIGSERLISHDQWDWKILDNVGNKPWKDLFDSYNNSDAQELPRPSANDPNYPDIYYDLVNEKAIKAILDKLVIPSTDKGKVVGGNSPYEWNFYYDLSKEGTPIILYKELPKFANQIGKYKIYKWKVHKLYDNGDKSFIVILISENAYLGAVLYLKFHNEILSEYDYIGNYPMDKLLLEKGRDPADNYFFQINPLYRISSEKKTLIGPMNSTNWDKQGVNYNNFEQIFLARHQDNREHTLQRQHTCFNRTIPYEPRTPSDLINLYPPYRHFAGDMSFPSENNRKRSFLISSMADIRRGPMKLPTEENIPVYQGNDAIRNNPFDDPSALQPLLNYTWNKTNCEASYDNFGRTKPAGVYDAPCERDDECVFGKCDKLYGTCNAPPNIGHLGFTKFTV